MTASLYRRIEASEKFAADVAHELKNPLTAARSTAESLSYARTDEQRDQLVSQIQIELKRLNRLITDVSNASRLDAELALQQREPVDLTGVLNGVATPSATSTPTTGARSCSRSSRAGGSRRARPGRPARPGRDQSDRQRALVLAGGRHGERPRAPRRGHVEFAVEDEGPGIEPDKLETVFDRFYTYRPTATASRGNNSGLGLSISREIVPRTRPDLGREPLRSGDGPGESR